MALQNDSFLQACRGLRPSRTPVWMMRQAGRYLPEYREVRSKVSFTELCRTPELCAEVTLQPIDILGVDAAILFSDILVVLDALGVEVIFDPAPRIEAPVRTVADVDRIRWGDPREEVAYVYAAVRACKAALADRVPLIGFCGAPFTTLSYLVEGKGSRDFEHIKGLCFREPGVFHGLMERMTDLLIVYLKAQVEAGADALQIFDSWAGALAPDDYREHVLPHLHRLVVEVQGAGVPVICFARGNANLLAEVATIPADVIGIDWSITLADAISVVGPERVVQGNLDPMVLLADAALIERKARAIVEAGKGARAHIFNLGHGISRHTDPGLARHLIEVVHSA
ncbi:MAG: uroporphyrinogen decarboxylase [Myxococcales bacterium]|nr:uroporphyrinogen decarboxylase [Myxococcales bacterium]